MLCFSAKYLQGNVFDLEKLIPHTLLYQSQPNTLAAKHLYISVFF